MLGLNHQGAKHPIQTNTCTVPKPSRTPKTLLAGKLATLLGWACFQVRFVSFAVGFRSRHLDHDSSLAFLRYHTHPPKYLRTPGYGGLGH